jgi:dTDP-4-dehydrorhamnose reductase
VVTTYFRHPQRIEGVLSYPLSVSNVDWVKRLLGTVKPDTIIYAAGKHQLHWTEAPDNSKALDMCQVGGPTQLLSDSQGVGSRFVFLSSCLVFDGEDGNYRELDTLIPATALGRAKLAAENAIKSRALNYLILRSAQVIGRGPSQSPTMIDQWLMRWSHGKPVELDDFTVHSFIDSKSYADWVSRCLAAPPTVLKNRILHYGGLSKVTEYDLACRLAKRLKISAGLVQRKTPGPGAEKLDYSLNFTSSVKSLEIQPLLLEQSLDLVEKDLLTP